MIAVQVQLVDFMTKEPVGGADLTMALKLVPRWQDYRAPRPESTAGVPEVVIVSEDPVEIGSGHVTRVESNAFVVSFNIDQYQQLFEGVVEERESGPIYSTPPSGARLSGRERIRPLAMIEGRIALAGLNQVARSETRLKGTDDSFTWVVHIDFAKVIVGHTTPDSALLWLSWHGAVRPSDYERGRVQAVGRSVENVPMTC